MRNLLTDEPNFDALRGVGGRDSAARYVHITWVGSREGCSLVPRVVGGSHRYDTGGMNEMSRIAAS
jgi:hypothetical protein